MDLGKKIQMTVIGNERGNFTEIKRIIKKYYEKYANKLNEQISRKTNY